MVIRYSLAIAGNSKSSNSKPTSNDIDKDTPDTNPDKNMASGSISNVPQKVDVKESRSTTIPTSSSDKSAEKHVGSGETSSSSSSSSSGSGSSKPTDDHENKEKGKDDGGGGGKKDSSKTAAGDKKDVWDELKDVVWLSGLGN